LQDLLDYNNEDLEQVFCRDFVATYRAFGEDVVVPLVPGGETTPVTLVNKHEYVEKYVDWYLNQSIKQQFEAFKQGFWRVLSGDAITLFQAEEIEEIVRGSQELDLNSLEAVTEYDTPRSASRPVVKWFWEYWKSVSPVMQRKVLMFITGSDRVPANGTTTMTFKISVGGPDCNRLPMSHTCFNQVILYDYADRDKFRRLMEMAVTGSEGFGIK
jgi:E3 ubiquitin-protein ligase HECTD2